MYRCIVTCLELMLKVIVQFINPYNLLINSLSSLVRKLPSKGGPSPTALAANIEQLYIL